MKKLCLRIVNFKLELDAELKMSFNKSDTFPSINPIDYGVKIFPFWTDEIYSRTPAVSVNCYEVVGGNFKDYSNQNQSINACNQLNSSASRGCGAPSYHRVGNFPIYFAGEGKNRVDLFRKHAFDITADVKDTNYPAPEALKIHRCIFGDSYFVSCSDKSIYNSNKLIYVAFPELTIPLLEAYGVQKGRTLFRFFTMNSREKVLKELSGRLMRK
jgi:hypothetical protein